jgi:hypothetical protein
LNTIETPAEPESWVAPTVRFMGELLDRTSSNVAQGSLDSRKPVNVAE